MQAISRTQFLQGHWRGKTLVRPPWSVSETLFIDACSTCGDCIKSCPENILELGRGHYPKVNFKLGECTFCGDCVDVCKTGALDRSIQPAFAFSINIDEPCLAYHGVECRACGDLCEIEAISFKPSLGGIAQPMLNSDSCTQCGACLSGCPVNALQIATELNQ